MPIIILGIIVAVGAGFLIFSSIKPKIGRRLSGGYGGFGFKGFDGLGAFQDTANESEPPVDSNVPASIHEGDENLNKRVEDDGKVLFIFGSGEREERSLIEDDDKDE